MTFKTSLSAAALCATLATASNAAVVVNVWEDGDDVFAFAAGSLDLNGADATYPAYGSPFFSPQSFNLGEHGVGALMDAYQFNAATGPATLGIGSTFSGGTTGTNLEFGMSFGTAASGNIIVDVEQGYTFGTIFTSNAFFESRTLSGMDLTVGSYRFTLPFDTITIEIGSAPAEGSAVPLPATALLSLLGLGALGFAGRKRKA